MINKLFALASVTGLAVLVAAGGAACSSSEDSPTTTKDAGNKDKDSGKPTGDDDDDDDDDDADGCYDESSASVLSDKVTAKFPGGNCSSEEVTQLISDCFDKDAGSADACKAFQTDHADCSTCAFGPAEDAESFDLPAFLQLEDSGLISIEACLAVVLGKPECALPLTNATFCTNTACATCKEADQAKCAEAADKGACGQIEISEDCQAVAETKDTAALAKCYTKGKSLESLSKTIDSLCRVGVGGDPDAGDGG